MIDVQSELKNVKFRQEKLRHSYSKLYFCITFVKRNQGCKIFHFSLMLYCICTHVKNVNSVKI